LLTDWDNAVRGATINHIKDKIKTINNEDLIKSLIAYFNTKACNDSINGYHSDEQVLIVKTVASSIKTDEILEKFLAVQKKTVNNVAIRAIAERLNEPFIQQSLLHSLDSEDPFARLNAANILLNQDHKNVAPTDSKEKAVTALVAMLENPAMNLSAAKILLHVRNKNLVKITDKTQSCQIVVEYLGSLAEGDTVDLKAVLAIAPQEGVSEGLPELVKLFRHKDPNVVTTAITAIASRASDPMVLPTLVDLLQDDRWQVVCKTIEALTPPPDDLLPTLVDLLQHKNDDIVTATINALASRADDPMVLPRLVELLENDNTHIVRTALSVLLPHAARPEISPKLVTLLQYAVEDQWPEVYRLPIANALIDAGVDSPEAYATIANQYNWRQGAKTLAQAQHPVLALKALLRSDEEDLSTLEGQLQGAVSTLTATDQQYYFVACSIPLDEETREKIGILLDKTYYAAMVGSYLALFQDYNKPGPKESYLSFKNWKIPSPLPEDLDTLHQNQKKLSKVLAAEWWLANDNRFSPANMPRSLEFEVFLEPEGSTPEECLSDTQTPEIIDPPHAHQPYNPHGYTR
jgi:HEAT repeat protein